MTKRDVAVWFCRVTALAGIVTSAFQLLSGLIGWGLMGGGNTVNFIVVLGFYGFVWLFASGIGAELAAEGEHGSPVTSGLELKGLLLRCVGASVFFSGSVNFALSSLAWGYQHFFGSSMPAIYARSLASNMGTGFLMSLIGFLFAFTPRIRQFFGK